jgi:CubicO group peptidase (beta-lactamase class C family)
MLGAVVGTVATFLPTGSLVTADPAKPDVDVERLDQFITTSVAAAHIPTAQVVVVSADDVVWAKSYGTAQPLETPFVIGSMSKSVTAQAVLQLVDQGLINLDDSLAQFIDPDHPAASFADNVTISELLTHTSGIQAFAISDITTQANKDFSYANANYGLLGHIIEQVSQVSYATYVSQHIFAPMGLSNSYADHQAALDGGLSPSYRNWFGFYDRQQPQWPAEQVPAGYISSSAVDLGRYLQTFLNHGQAADGTQVFAPEMLATIATAAVPSGPQDRYAMGWQLLDMAGQTVYRHDGATETFSSYMALIPEREIAVVILLNAGDYLGGWMIGGFYEELNAGVTNILLDRESDANESINTHRFTLVHLGIDVVWLLLLLASAGPLLRYRHWRAQRVTRQNTKLPLSGIVILALAGLIWVPFVLTGQSVSTVAGFAPEVIVVFALASPLLALGAILRLVRFRA